MLKLLRCLALFLLCLNAEASLAALRVVATLPAFGALAQAVGGERVQVTALSKPEQDPHFLEPKPSFVAELNQADLVIYNGMELEIGWLPPLLLQSRNPKIQTAQPGNLDASLGIQALELPSGPIDRSQGDIHPQGNPHYWLNPENGRRVATQIGARLKLLDPEGAPYYDAQLQRFNAQLDNRLKQWQPRLAPLKGKKIVTYHRSLSYFVDWSGLRSVAQIEPKPGIPPNSRQVATLLETMRREGVQTLLVENFYPRKVPEMLAQQSSVPLRVVSTQSNGLSAEDYFGIFDRLLEAADAVASKDKNNQ